jgi:hypothetical protein
MAKARTRLLLVQALADILKVRGPSLLEQTQAELIRDNMQLRLGSPQPQTAKLPTVSLSTQPVKAWTEPGQAFLLRQSASH